MLYIVAAFAAALQVMLIITRHYAAGRQKVISDHARELRMIDPEVQLPGGA